MLGNIDRLVINYTNARKSWESWCFLNNLHLKNSKPEIIYYVLNNKLLSHLRFLSLKDFQIELYKILKDSKNNKDNIYRLLKEIPEGDSRKSSADKNLLDLANHKKFIMEIIDIRDKFYAHLDKDFKLYIGKEKLVSDLYRCFELIEESIITLTSLEYLMNCLAGITSRDDFELNINVNN